MMKVLMICTVPLVGNGIAACVMNYAVLLAEEGCQCHILAPENVPEEVLDRLKARNVILHQLRNRKKNAAKYFCHLINLIHTERYDVVHVHGNSCTVAIELLAATLAGCSVRIAHSHNTSCDYKKAHKLLRPLFELCVNGRLACGEEAGKWLFHNKPFQVIRNGINLQRYKFDSQRREALRSELGIDDDTLVLGHIGLFVPAKNHEFLIKVTQKLAQRGTSKFKLLCVGDGPLMEQIRMKADEHVIFTGSIPDASGYFQAMDVFLLPSVHEGLPFVLIEAQAAGLQCVVSECVSQEADITDSLKFLPIEEAEVWAREIEAYTQDDDRQTTSERACTKLQQAKYDMQSNAGTLKHYYAGLRKD